MKKRNLFLVLMFGLFIFGLVGITKVNAAYPDSFQIVCVPKSLEIGGRANCYIIANFQTTDALYGVYSRAITKDLTIKNVGTGQTGVDAGLFYAGQKSGKNKNGLFNCDTALGKDLKNHAGTSIKDLGYKDSQQCAYFESSSSTPSIKKGYTSSKLTSEFTNDGFAYTEIGYYDVELDSTATAQNCGTICVDVWYSLTATQTTTLSNPTVNESQEKTNFPASTVCSEITPTTKPKDEPNTGNFASYTVLIAGACIAIAAIAIASKNNRLYKV